MNQATARKSSLDLNYSLGTLHRCEWPSRHCPSIEIDPESHLRAVEEIGKKEGEEEGKKKERKEEGENEWASCERGGKGEKRRAPFRLR